MARLFTGPFFPYLEDRLADEIVSAKRDDPFREVAVIVPTRAVGRRLQSVIAGRGAVLNLNFFTFYTLSLWLLKSAGQEVRPVTPAAVMPLLLKQVIETDLPTDEYTAYLLSYKSSLTRLLGLFSRFTSYRIEPPGRLSGMEKTVFAAYRAFCGRKRDRAIGDADDLIGRAAELLAAETVLGAGTAVFLYGFYDLNPVQRDIVRLLDKQAVLTVLCPGGWSAEAEEFFRETAAFYRDIAGGGDGHDSSDGAGPEPVLLPIARSLFSPPGQSRREAGGAVRLITASGPVGEARAVALEILRLHEQRPSLLWRDIVVTMREAFDFSGVLADAFAEFSIPAVFDGGRPLSSMPEAGYFLVMLSALERGLARDDVAFLVSSAFFAWPGLPADNEAWVRDNAYLAAAVGKKYRVIAGKAEWDNAFTRHRERPRIDLFDEEMEEMPADDRDRAMTRYVQATEAIISGFLGALTDIPPEAEPAEYRDRFASLISTYMRPADGEGAALDQLGEVLETLTAISSVRRTITRDDCIGLLRDAVFERRASSPRDVDGVFVSDVMGCRGLPARVVFLMGMNEKVFPRAFGRDPFLSDRTGSSLGMPTAASRLLEDRTLFALTVGSAQELLVISRQRSDDAGRNVSPSPFLAELASRVTVNGAPVSLASPLSEPAGRDYPRITAIEGGLSRYRRQDARTSLCLSWPDDRVVGAVRGVVSETPFLRGGLVAVDERASDRPLSKYDGLIGPVAGIIDRITPLSSQRLETYASCPFDFFMRYVLSVREQETVEEELDVQYRELGLIYHRILSGLMPVLVERGLFGPGEADPVIIDGLVEGHVGKAVLGRLSGRIPALILRARQEHAVLIMGRLVRREREAGVSGFVPARYETPFGFGADASPGNPALTLDVGPHTVDFVGKIDRIDVNRTEGAFAVVDYKRKKGSGARRLKTEIAAGRHFQLPIYIMAADKLLSGEGCRPGGGGLVYLEADGDKDYRETLSGPDYAEIAGGVVERIGAVIEAMAAGDFTPARSESCRFCASRDLCRSDIKAVGAARRKKGAGEAGGDGEDDVDDET